MPRARKRLTRGKDTRPRTVSPASLANLKEPFPAVLDGSESLTTRLRLSPGDARTWRRMDHEERRRVVELGLRVRENGG